MEAWIIDAVRTPTGRKNGGLSGIRADELVTVPMRAVLERSGVDAAQVEDVIMGCVTPIGEQGWNIGRQAALMAGFPLSVTGTTINRMCGSGLQALHWAAQGVMSGVHDLVMAAGTESMSRVPLGSDGGDLSPRLMEMYEIVPQHRSAEMIAAKWGFTRRDLDEYSLESHRRAAVAWAEGRFASEVVPVGAVSQDETVRPGTTLEKMMSLPLLFPPDGVIHAGNSSPICDGAAAALVASPEKAKELGLKPRARIRSMALAGVDPTMMLHGVMPATQKALQKAGLTMQDIDLYEVNEAFASVPLAWMHDLGIPHQKLNVNGGAIALGHPLGASGIRITATLLSEMERRDAMFGLATMCIGFGMAIATVFERM
ncbi:MAG TPA: thiolase family protein [Symbiobacteriaceae bacterium]|nr:thiolase family protein [Symbiobacteriaceae bacterium]